MTCKQCPHCEGLFSTLQCLEWLSFGGKPSQLSAPVMSAPYFRGALTWRLRLHCYDSTTVYWCQACRSLISCLPQCTQSRTNTAGRLHLQAVPTELGNPRCYRGVSMDRAIAWHSETSELPELPSSPLPCLQALCFTCAKPSTKTSPSHSPNKLALLLKGEFPAPNCARLPWQRWVLWGF